MTRMIDGWDNVNHAHVVNFLAIVGSVFVFLDSAMVGFVKQNAENQAKIVQDILNRFNGVKSFAAVVTDNKKIFEYARVNCEEELWQCKLKLPVPCFELTLQGLVRD